MPRLTWDDSGERTYETGVKMGVLYPQTSGAYPKGIAWNGLTSVTESPSGAESNPQYADDIKYLDLYSAEEFGATINAFTYPDEFSACDGSAELVKGAYIGQQNRQSFGLCYRTTLGNDTEGNEYGYKLHIIYGAKASPSEKAYNTINDSPEAIEFSWELTTTPVKVTGHKPTANLIIDSTKVNKEKLTALEDILYGKDGSGSADARLPLPDEIFTILGGSAVSGGKE
nr:MAG TPA: tail tube protein [Caudoviricetes sp.]